MAEHRQRYEAREPDAIVDYCDLVLSASEYPDWMPSDWQLDYQAETGLLIVEYQLPAVEDLPTLKSVSYVQSRDEFRETEHSASAIRTAYDGVIYQLVLRTIHELFEADVVEALKTVVFNGRITTTDPATGHEINACIASLSVGREEFLGLNLAAVDPKKCFRKLRGVGASKLHVVTPVPPIIEIPRDDSRFTESYEVVSTLDEGENLALMDWEDFEHLVREVFEQEFAGNGAEVKVTRASRDGGIDAVVFDPDPIRGGNIVIQAKRYTKTVGVSAVRDLFGAIQHEGAMKGILVSTAPFGPDSYEFAKDKPITLIDGGTLLHLMHKHGHRVRIDLREAREARQEQA